MNIIEQAIAAMEAAHIVGGQQAIDGAIAALKAHQQAAQDVELPPLPEAWIEDMSAADPASRLHFAADQMREYALQWAASQQEAEHIHLAWRGALKACDVNEADRDALSEVVLSMLAESSVVAAAPAQQAAEGEVQRDADRWRQLAHMEASMVAPETLAHYIARPDRLDYVAKLRAEHGAASPTAQGERE